MPSGKSFRSRIEEGAESLRISMPAHRRWGFIVFSAFWCGFLLLFTLGIALALVTGEPGARDPLFYEVIGGLLPFGLFMLAMLLWQLFGRDVIELRAEVLTATKRMPGFQRSRAFPSADMRDLHASSTTRSPGVFWWPGPISEQWGITGGRIVFEYQGRTYRYGTGISYEEAQHLVSLLGARVSGRRVAPPEAEPEPVASEEGPLHVVIRPKRQWALWAFWTFWLASWLGSGVSLLFVRPEFGPPEMPEAFATIMWAFVVLFLLFGVVVFLSWLWVTFGCEVIDVDEEQLLVRREMPLLPSRRRFLLGRLRRLRSEPRDTAAAGLGVLLNGSFWGLSGGPVAFEYDGRTHRFGAGLDESAARRLVARILARFPTLK